MHVFLLSARAPACPNFPDLFVPGKPEKKEKKVEHHQAAKPAATKKKQEKWAPRESKQAFAHPWMITSLKGHTGEVLDMDFSGNAKFLATCSDGESYSSFIFLNCLTVNC